MRALCVSLAVLFFALAVPSLAFAGSALPYEAVSFVYEAAMRDCFVSLLSVPGIPFAVPFVSQFLFIL